MTGPIQVGLTSLLVHSASELFSGLIHLDEFEAVTIELRAWCLWGKHSDHWTKSPALGNILNSDHNSIILISKLGLLWDLTHCACVGQSLLHLVCDALCPAADVPDLLRAQCLLMSSFLLVLSYSDISESHVLNDVHIEIDPAYFFLLKYPFEISHFRHLGLTFSSCLEFKRIYKFKFPCKSVYENKTVSSNSTGCTKESVDMSTAGFLHHC